MTSASTNATLQDASCCLQRGSRFTTRLPQVATRYHRVRVLSRSRCYTAPPFSRSPACYLMKCSNPAYCNTSSDHQQARVAALTKPVSTDTGSGHGRGGSSLGTQLDSSSLRTPVTLKSLSTAFQRRRPATVKGVSCNTIPDTRSTASLPVKNSAANGALSDAQDRDNQVRNRLPAPCTNLGSSCQQDAPQGCLNAPAAHSADQPESAQAAAPVLALNACANIDTSRVLFTSPQESAGLCAPYVSPTGGALQDVLLEQPGAGPVGDTSEHAPQHEKPSAPSSRHTRALTDSEQQFLLSQDIGEGALLSSCCSVLHCPSVTNLIRAWAPTTHKPHVLSVLNCCIASFREGALV
jgi:hypothetical protein